MTRFSPLLLALALAACTAAPAPLGDGPSGDLAPHVLPVPPEAALAAIDSTELRAHIAALASDAFEGRGTGTPGEEKAVSYIIAQMRAMGLVGGMPDGSFRQPVPLRSVRATSAQDLAFVPANGGDPAPLAYGPDLIGVPDGTISALDLAGAEMVFVGYGITNPGYDWDDYKDADVRGKVVVSFVNDPPATNAEPTLFQADTLTYNGRWTYKYEEARRRGALAMLLIHTDATAGYPSASSTATRTASTTRASSRQRAPSRSRDGSRRTPPAASRRCPGCLSKTGSASRAAARSAPSSCPSPSRRRWPSSTPLA